MQLYAVETDKVLIIFKFFKQKSKLLSLLLSKSNSKNSKLDNLLID
jgi:hypothetical protein